jgi:ABC-type multidrug transport system ATPase subunit
MDEPSTGLDPASRYNLWNVVKESKQNRAIILTSMFLIPFSADLLTYLLLLIGYEGLLRSIT